MLQLSEILPTPPNPSTDPAAILRTLARYAGSGTDAVIVPDMEHARVLVTDAYAARIFHDAYAESLARWVTDNRANTAYVDYLDGLPVVLRISRPVGFAVSRAFRVTPGYISAIFPTPDTIATEYAAPVAWETDIRPLGTGKNRDVPVAVAVRADGTRVVFRPGLLAFAGANIPGAEILISSRDHRPAVITAATGFRVTGAAMPTR